MIIIYLLGKYREIEITPDIIILGYETALKENQYLHENYPEISEKVWIIGCTGQGDEWFVNKTKIISCFMIITKESI